MRVGIRGKLFLVTVGLIVAVALSVEVYLAHALGTARERALEGELARHARTTREVVELTQPQTARQADRLSDRLGEAMGSRVTIIRSNGVVIGDSEVDLEGLANLENHGQRPEIVDARTRGLGSSRRYSTTLDADMLYVAVPWENGVIRVAMASRVVDEVLAPLRWTLLIASLVSVIAAIVVSWLASQWMSRALRGIVDAAQAMAGGLRRAPLPEFGRDELGGLAGSLNKLAADLEGAVNTLAHERNRFETVLQSMEEALLSTDRHRKIEIVNASAHRLLGLPRGVEGRSLVEAVRIPALIELVDTTLNERDSASVEFDLPSNGRRVLASATPQGTAGGLVIVMHDVTEIRRLETIRRDFVANVSHELRTPVSIIRANAETLLGGAMEDSEQAQRFLEALVRNADRLGRLISDLLDISRIEAGKYSIDSKTLDIGPLAQRVVDAVEARARDRGVTIDLAIEEPTRVLADARALEQVLTNLIDNAVNYSREGGIVEIRAENEDGTVRIQVVDDGPGIDPVHRARIFERFYRIDPGRSRDMGGTGLGLSIVKHLVEAMGGTVGVGARMPRGSIFWLRLPTNDHPDPANDEAHLAIS